MAGAARRSWADMSACDDSTTSTVYWPDTEDSDVEDFPAPIQSNQFTGHVVDSEMPQGLPLQDLTRFTHAETLDTVDLAKNGQSCVASQPEVNWQQQPPFILVAARCMPCMVFAQKPEVPLRIGWQHWEPQVPEVPLQHGETCQFCKKGQACAQHCPCRNAQQPCQYHVPCPVGCPKKFQCAHPNCKRGARCKFCHCMKQLQ